jgi:hypothetical protein
MNILFIVLKSSYNNKAEGESLFKEQECTLKIISFNLRNPVIYRNVDYLEIPSRKSVGAFRELEVTISVSFSASRASWNFKSNAQKGNAHLYGPKSRERESTIDYRNRRWESPEQEMMFVRDRLKLHEILFRS